MAHDFVKKIISEEGGVIRIMTAFTLLGVSFLAASLAGSYCYRGDFNADFMALAGAVMLAIPLFWTSLADLLRGRMEMNELAALGVLAALAGGEYVTAGAISFFMFISIFIEHQSATGAEKSIRSMMALAPVMARRLGSEGIEEEVDVSELRAGDVVRIKPGDRLPGDGRVTRGQSAVDESSITGESVPVEKTVDDGVFAGTMNSGGVMEVEIARLGEDSVLGQVKKLILHARKTKTAVARTVDRYATWYTPLILVLAGIVVLVTRDLSRAISMLIIACPCSIMLSTPTAMVAALGAAARLGVLVKTVGHLEVAGRVNTVVFDKTGTLTTGELKVTRIAPAEGISELELLALAAGLENNSTHPVALAVVSEAVKRSVPIPGAEEFEENFGMGVAGRVGEKRVYAGKREWVEAGIPDLELPTNEETLSVLHVAVDSRYAGWIGLEDGLRPNAATALEKLKLAGVDRALMLTGDREVVAEKVAAEAGGMDFVAGALPEKKLEIVNELRKSGRTVCVVGDGVNDGPALAAGDVSVAMGAAGSDVAVHSATIALMNNNLERIPFILRLSRETLRVVRQNLGFSIGFIVFLLMASAAGYIHPVLAAALHSSSALFVIFNSARLIRKEDDAGKIGVHETRNHRNSLKQGPAKPASKRELVGQVN